MDTNNKEEKGSFKRRVVCVYSAALLGREKEARCVSICWKNEQSTVNIGKDGKDGKR